VEKRGRNGPKGMRPVDLPVLAKGKKKTFAKKEGKSLRKTLRGKPGNSSCATGNPFE